MTQQLGDSEAERTRLTARFQGLLSGASSTQVIYVAAELRIADLLAERPHTIAELAELTSSHEPSLRRLLHALMAIGVCRDGPDGSFELASMGALLRSDSPDSLRSWALWWGRSLWPAWGNLLHSVKTGESARAQLTGMHGFDHLALNREDAAVFYQATVELSRLSAPAILAAYDFSGFARIVDVGGGYGELLSWILRANPAASGVLLELPHAIAGARQHIDEAGLGNRCEIVEGDFFSDVPRGGDLYLLKSVLHDWRDARASQILAACRRAMDEDSRLVLVEEQFPESEGAPPELGIAVGDLTMLVAHGAGERTRSEFKALLQSAGFAVTRSIPVASTLHIIEAIPAGFQTTTPSRNL